MQRSAQQVSAPLRAIVHHHKMVRLFSLMILAACVASALILLKPSGRHTSRGEGLLNTPAKRDASLASMGIRAYTDIDYGFSMAVPANWKMIVAADAAGSEHELEPGHAVGFESPKSSEHDVFADYIMVEILPGSESGVFQTNGRHTQAVLIDGKPARQDRLELPQHRLDGGTIDLVILQAELLELGFTVAFYAIGEPHEEPVLAEAFEVLIRTFSLPQNPFDIS